MYEEDPPFVDADGIPGMPTMTADGQHVVGPAPDVTGREDDPRRDAAWQYRHFYGAA